MADITFLDTLGVIIQSVLLLIASIASAALIIRSRNKLLTIFFTFAMISWFLSDLYWLTYDVLRPETRMPLAANEFGECALFLLLAAGITPYISKDKPRSIPGIVYALLFCAANTALWIVWSGEWLQDIVCGIAMSIYAYTLVIVLIQTDSIPKPGRITIAVLSALVIGIQTLTSYVKTPVTSVLEYSSYVLMYSVLIYLYIRTLRLHKEKVRTVPFLLSIAAMIWNSFTLYMSPGFIYTVSLVLYAPTLTFMYITLRREVLADDLR